MFFRRPESLAKVALPLIDLLIVLAILAVLAAIILPIFDQAATRRADRPLCPTAARRHRV